MIAVKAFSFVSGSRNCKSSSVSWMVTILFVFSCDYLFNGCYSIRSIQAIFFQEFVGRTAFSKGVFCTDILLRGREIPGQRLCDSVTKTADDIMFFCRDRAFCLLDRFQDGGSIERFYRVQIDHLGLDAFFFEDPGGFDCLPYQVA